MLKKLGKFVSLVFIIISISLFFYTYYKSEIIWHGEIRTYYFQYYIGSSILIFLSIVSFYLNSDLKINIFLIILSTVFTLFCLEVFLVIYAEKKLEQLFLKKKELYLKESGKQFEKADKLQVYKTLKQQQNLSINYNSKEYFNAKKMNILPLSGASNIKTIDCNENGYFNFYQSDRYGFNNINKNWDQDIIDLLIVGDSFGQGSCVNNEQSIVGHLKDKSNKSIINLSFGGNGPLSEYATLKEYLPNLKVKKVIWLFYPNDLDNLSKELNNPILKKYLAEDNFKQDLINKQATINIIVERHIDQAFESFESSKLTALSYQKIFNFLKLTNLRTKFQPITPDTFWRANSPTFKEIMYKAKEFVELNNAELYFVYLPSYDEVISSLTYKENREVIFKIINDLGITSAEIMTDVEKLQNSLSIFPFKLPGHYNSSGYEIVADKIKNITNR